ncbi:glycerophosphodiester phosphodiesterase [Paenibacillus sp. GCM10023248]|uniref:glycerophosphodiester phosphodiesterase n=1 Tax=Bacillales TaxID=1385 RepID=UPI002377ED82|nr:MULTISPECIES: glycerophosphodiester phosphodiesterase family protein [Bacillales]MDD9268048.1 glycerophosphodiester phosphodiesterase family protein [Paenibacillus sp. MAHUQ-63]MDR6879721.1 glycerophosphoryl diester phosphodiesterase [Bacillus sp. 3255]
MEVFPKITAHTGCMGMPDNTRRSLEAGLRSGADILEEDLLLTADGVLVLSHDDLVRLADGTERLISQLSFAQLSELEVRAHGGVPGEMMKVLPLDAILPFCEAPGIAMNLDLKSDACVEPVAAWVEQHGLTQRVLLSGCELERALLVQQVNPQLRKLLNVDPAVFTAHGYMDAVRLICEDAVRAHCFGLNLNYSVVRPELIRFAAKYGLEVYVWTVNDEPLMKTFIAMGVHSITTRNVAALMGWKYKYQNGTVNE